jgi:lysozyme
MGISAKGLDLIKAFEGFKSETYKCPAGVLTIGYGTTRYPNGKTVQVEDEVSEQQAEAFLLYDCNKFSQDVDRLVKVPLNQNQKDALISFCYNLGTGAFAGSTMLKLLNQGDYKAAAQEFPKWNKATIDGVKQVLPGLTRRRQEEKLLFESVGNEGEVLEPEASVQDQVTWLELYRSEGGNNVLAAWNGSQLIELLSFDRPLKEDLSRAFMQYRNAQNVHVADATKKIPTAEVIKVAAPEQAIAPPEKVAPPLVDKVLQRGSEGLEVSWLQERLSELNYYKGKIDGDFGYGTESAVREFQTAMFGSSQADGKVNSLTWKTLDGSPLPRPETFTRGPKGSNYLRLTKTNTKDQNGLYRLRLAYFKDKKEVDSMFVCSGLANKQYFRIGKLSKAKSFEPLPEGKWYVHDIDWKGGKDNYSRNNSWETGVGPVRIALDYIKPDWTERKAILIHLDENVPGTAGCIGVYTVADFKRLVSWLRDTDPRDLYVDWGLGTCPQPEKELVGSPQS